MAEKGTLAKRGRRVSKNAALPEVAILEINGIDRDGELVAVPADWDETTAGPLPRITLLHLLVVMAPAARSHRPAAAIVCSPRSHSQPIPPIPTRPA